MLHEVVLRGGRRVTDAMTLSPFLPIFRFIDNVTYFHVEGPVLTLQGAIGRPLWKERNRDTTQ